MQAHGRQLAGNRSISQLIGQCSRQTHASGSLGVSPASGSLRVSLASGSLGVTLASGQSSAMAIAVANPVQWPISVWHLNVASQCGISVWHLNMA